MVNFSLKDARLWFFRAFVHEVVNGDTIMAMVDKGFHDFTYMRLRLNGVDAPSPDPRSGSHRERDHERRLGLKARARLIELVESREVLVQSHRTLKIDRYRVDLFLPETPETSVNSLLLAEGLAVKFGQSPPWRSG